MRPSRAAASRSPDRSSAVSCSASSRAVSSSCSCPSVAACAPARSASFSVAARFDARLVEQHVAAVAGGDEQPLPGGGVDGRRGGGVEVLAHLVRVRVEHHREVGHHARRGEQQGGEVLQVATLHVHQGGPGGELAVGGDARPAGGGRGHARLAHRLLGVGQLLLGPFLGGDRLGHPALQRLEPHPGAPRACAVMSATSSAAAAAARLRPLDLGRAGHRPARGGRRLGGLGPAAAPARPVSATARRGDDGTAAEPTGKAHLGIIAPIDRALSPLGCSRTGPTRAGRCRRATGCRPARRCAGRRGRACAGRCRGTRRTAGRAPRAWPGRG